MRRNIDILRTGESPQKGFPSSLTPSPYGMSRAHDRAVANELRNLVCRLFLLPSAGDAPGVVAFCGIKEASGCTWVCAKASETLAEQVAGRVCVADFKRQLPSLVSHLPIAREIVLSKGRRDPASPPEFVRHRWIPNLWAMVSGAAPEDEPGKLNADSLRAKFSKLRTEFDYVLVDVPPADSCDDAVLLGQLTDGVVLV